MTFRLPTITCPAEGYKSFEFLQSQGSGVLESIFISSTILLKLNIVDLNGLIYLKQMIGVSELLKKFGIDEIT